MTEEVDTQYRACARDALQLYATATGQFAVPQEGTVKFQATFPLAMYALNQVHAALILAENKREYLAVANVRVAYEHAVTAQWVLFTRSAEEKLVGTLHRHNRFVVKDLATYANVPDELLTGFGEQGDPVMPNFKVQCEALNPSSDALISLYRNLTVGVHPSSATLAQHLTASHEHGITGVRLGAVQEAPVDTWMGCALSTLAAAFVIEVQREDQPRMPQVMALSEKYRVPFDLRR
ncbi:hypothetical protein SAMN05443575_1466 [Jatrophihabitans endophyticus]|uniref:Uncharacterized protein n=1 Tax=Jatrophihabitans endophyticus TaxID=1206085 RepID=A0A1M5HBQ8_9ACTN|nr:hypothetical protein [Jatrophihabitans endophyticus]SHG13419.1 hypothetical protein SAMN05443575_1466 [Jatrophihabitans endophyticus]